MSSTRERRPNRYEVDARPPVGGTETRSRTDVAGKTIFSCECPASLRRARLAGRQERESEDEPH
jgi:hypothetical protein